MSRNKPPSAFFDTLEETPNPYRHPIRSLQLNPGVDGSASQIQDLQFASEFLYSYRGSPDTFSTYRRELEHFLQWCFLIADKSLDAITREDIESFAEFTQHPPKAWIGEHTAPRYLLKDGQKCPNPDWRPYVGNPDNYTPATATLQIMFSVLSSFFNYLAQERYVTINPVAQIRQKSRFLRRRQGLAQVRRLSPLQWNYVIETAEELAKSDPAQHERTLFVLNALFAMYLRISELVENSRWSPQMGHFRQDFDGNWWFLTVGKGNKEREISVSDAMLEALRRYRRSRGLSALPIPGESTPLIHRFRGKGGITSTRQIRMIVQACFDHASDKMRRDGFTEEAERLDAATVHWLRHTGISEDVKHRPREHVRDDAGHGSSAVTDRYIDVERAERHASARNKVIKS